MNSRKSFEIPGGNEIRKRVLEFSLSCTIGAFRDTTMVVCVIFNWHYNLRIREKLNLSTYARIVIIWTTVENLWSGWKMCHLRRTVFKPWSSDIPQSFSYWWFTRLESLAFFQMGLQRLSNASWSTDSAES